MAITDCLIHRDPDPDAEGYLPPAELLRRVATLFPLAIIDRERGDRVIRAEADNLARLMNPTDRLVELHRQAVGRVAYVTIRDATGGPQFGFLLRPRPTMIEIEYERPGDRQVCRPLLESLAVALAEYDILTEDLDD
ncbi:MAG: hypothetical protein FJ304_24835 [Planctomycetes bacterium]|nr:hypothetical protein [Planctomycetota bacterium]